jgi:hypothetical protein
MGTAMKYKIFLIMVMLVFNPGSLSSQTDTSFDVYYDIEMGFAMQEGIDIALDNDGDIYILFNEHVTGTCGSGAEGSYCLRIKIKKVDVETNTVVYTFYLTNGTSTDSAASIAVDSNGSVYIAGIAHSSSSYPTNMPVQNAFDPTMGDNDGDAFLSRLNPAGDTLLYSTFIGGSGTDYATDVAVTQLWLLPGTGSTDFPVQNAYQNTPESSSDAFVTVIDTTQSGAASLLYSTYLGGSSNEQGGASVIDGNGDVYILGRTRSADFPLVSPYQSGFAAQLSVYSAN